MIDFEILFPEVDANALMSVWPTIREKPKTQLNVSIDSIDDYHKQDELHDLLTFVKAFPNHRTKFENAVKSFMIFSNVCVKCVLCMICVDFICNNVNCFDFQDPTVDPLHLLKGQSDVPRIIIIFSEEDSITKFYVCVQKSLFSVSELLINV